MAETKIIKLPDVDLMRSEIKTAYDNKYTALAGFTDGLAWDKKRYIEKTKEALQMHVLSAVAAGRRLIVIKEMLDHGEFIEALEEIGGLNERTAQKYMAVARKFMNVNEETQQALGMGRMYAMLKSPVEELEKIESEGTYLGSPIEEVITIPVRELNERIAVATGKVKLDHEQEVLKGEKLYLENTQLKESNSRLQSELITAKTGAPPQDPLPEWWNEYTAVTGALAALATKLAAHAPHHENEVEHARCELVLKRIRHEMAHCEKYLMVAAVDPVEFERASREKMAALSTDKRFDFTQLDNED